MISTRVSNELGAGNPEGARSAVRVVMFLAVMEAAIVSSTLLASRKILGYAYSNEEEVIAYVTKMVPLVCISVITDSLQGVLSGFLLITILPSLVFLLKWFTYSNCKPITCSLAHFSIALNA